jgi:hypothetical protein
MFWMVIMEFFSKIDAKRTESELDKWFEQLKERGRELGVEVEPLSVCERIRLEHDARWGKATQAKALEFINAVLSGKAVKM